MLDKLLRVEMDGIAGQGVEGGGSGLCWASCAGHFWAGSGRKVCAA